MILSMIFNADKILGRINRNIYGHFAEHLGRCIYDGIWVGEGSSIPNQRGIRVDVVEALRNIKIPVLRWPGGCFADDYHWKDGIGDREKRPQRINVHWSRAAETNAFGTHEFFELCELLDTQPYICGNVGTGTAAEMRDWVEYITSDADSSLTRLRRENGREDPWQLPFFGIGNENWGCGGHMRAEYYSDLYRRYAQYVGQYGGEAVSRIACGANSTDYRWTEVLMQRAASSMEILSLHYYSGFKRDLEHYSRAADFDEEGWFLLLKKAFFTEELLTKHSTIMDRYDPDRRVGLAVDEWGSWHDVEPGTHPRHLYQQNTLRDALLAGITLNIFNTHCPRVVMANIAQTVNVLQSMVLTEGDRMLLTPTYHVFDMYSCHQNASLVDLSFAHIGYRYGNDEIPAISASASMGENGHLNISICHTHPDKSLDLSCELRGWEGTEATGLLLTAHDMTTFNSFDSPKQLAPVEMSDIRVRKGFLEGRLPPKSVVVVKINAP